MLKRLAPLLGTNYQYPVWNRALELSGMFAYAASVLVLTSELALLLLHASNTVATNAMAWSLPVAGLAFLAADFVSGLVHCAADNFGSPATPFFGVAFIRPFRDHHRDPADITRHDFVETNGNSCIANLFVMIPACFLLTGAPNALKLSAGIFILMFAFAITMTNQIHKWAHMQVAPRWVARLQRLGLILSPANHAVHHAQPFDKNYCITTGWMNRYVERFGFFAWLVRTVNGR